MKTAHRRFQVRLKTLLRRVEIAQRSWAWETLFVAGKKRVGLAAPSGRKFWLQTCQGKWWIVRFEKDEHGSQP